MVSWDLPGLILTFNFNEKLGRECIFSLQLRQSKLVLIARGHPLYKFDHMKLFSNRSEFQTLNILNTIRLLLKQDMDLNSDIVK